MRPLLDWTWLWNSSTGMDSLGAKLGAIVCGFVWTAGDSDASGSSSIWAIRTALGAGERLVSHPSSCLRARSATAAADNVP